MGIKAIQAAVAVNQFFGGLRTYPHNPRHIIRTVADKGKELKELLGIYGIFTMHRLPVHHLVLHGIPHHHIGPDELEKILVARDQHNLVALRGKGPHHRGDDIVRLHPLFLKHQDIRGLDKLSDIWNLELQIVRHGRPVCLIRLIYLMAKNRSAAIEGNCNILRLLFPQEAPDHVDETKNRMGRHSFAVRKGRDCMIGTIDIGTSVNEIYFFFQNVELPSRPRII
ncbi:MAG: hypothetical protein ACD_75C02519G0001 [uncultured bacterium]|nr:MAG: hypothetical protein ACD_75C02519G0001 [uncultured bacterium]